VASLGDEDDGPFDGINIELPFFTFRAGRGSWGFGMSVNEDDAYRRARRRVRARLSFYRHLATYGAVIVSLFVLDAITGGGWWVQWPAAIWGALIVWHYFNVFVFPAVWSRETEERMIEEELKRERDRSG
jgi:fatty acid desaturase